MAMDSEGGMPMTSIAPPEAISVVYVEDDEKLARLTARYLESHGVRVTVAKTANDGIREVSRVRPGSPVNC